MKKLLLTSSLAIAMTTTLTGCITALSHGLASDSGPSLQQDIVTVTLDTLTLPFQIPLWIMIATEKMDFNTDASNFSDEKYSYTNIPSYFTGNKEYEEEYLKLKKKFDIYVNNHYRRYFKSINIYKLI